MDDSGSFPSVEVDFKKAGKWLRQAREDLHLSIRELAKMCGFSATQINRMETGEDFTVAKLVKLAVAVGLPPGLVIDYNLIVHPGLRVRERLATLLADPELSALAHATAENDVAAAKSAILELVDLITVCACKLLVSANPSSTLQALEVPQASLRENLARFIRAYGLETDSAERATVFRAIVQRPLRKLQSLGLLTKEVVEEYLAARGDEGKTLSSGLKLDPGLVTSSPVPNASSEWSQLVARVIQVTGRYGAKAQLARDLGVTSQAVNQWLTGVNAPSAETTLRLLQWVTAAETKKK